MLAIYHFDIYAMRPWSTPTLGEREQREAEGKQRYKLTPVAALRSGRQLAINVQQQQQQQQMENNCTLHEPRLGGNA